MLLAIALCLGVAAVLIQAYGAANPMRMLDGEISGKIPLFSFLLENHLSGNSPAEKHMYFAMWIREIGFALIPWVALVPLGIGYLARAARIQEEDGTPIKDILSAPTSLHRLLLVWSFVAVAVVSLASAFNHIYFPAYLPLMLGTGLMLGDAGFFTRARLHSLTLVATGFVAITIIMMLGKDLERFPDRFMEPYLAMQEELGLPEDFKFGSMLKAIKYGWMILLAIFYFELVSWAGLTLRSIRSAPKRFAAWRARRKDATQDGDTAAAEVAPPLAQRARAKEAYRAEQGLLPRVAAYLNSRAPGRRGSLPPLSSPPAYFSINSPRNNRSIYPSAASSKPTHKPPNPAKSCIDTASPAATNRSIWGISRPSQRTTPSPRTLTARSEERRVGKE